MRKIEDRAKRFPSSGYSKKYEYFQFFSNLILAIFSENEMKSACVGVCGACVVACAVCGGVCGVWGRVWCVVACAVGVCVGRVRGACAVRGVCVVVCGGRVGCVRSVGEGKYRSPLYYPDTLVNPDTCLGISSISCFLLL